MQHHRTDSDTHDGHRDLIELQLSLGAISKAMLGWRTIDNGFLKSLQTHLRSSTPEFLCLDNLKSSI